MEKKYYFRGLGLGIIVTAVIMGIALSGGTKKRELTDEEVIARAKELGMTEDTRLLEPSDEEEGKTEPEADDKTVVDTPVKKDVAVKTEAELEKKQAEMPEESAGPNEAEKAETKPKADTNEMNKQDDEENSAQAKTEETGDTKPAQSKTEEAGDTKPAQSKTEENSDVPPASGRTKSVTIVSGDSSYTIAKKLETAGVVSSASSYDTYLCEHGYDKKLRPGTFQIPAGATEEQIAKIVTGQ